MYWPRVGTSVTGPWTNYPYTDLCSAALPTPAAGQTFWYTVAAELNGAFSGNAPPVSLTAPYIPLQPTPIPGKGWGKGGKKK